MAVKELAALFVSLLIDIVYFMNRKNSNRRFTGPNQAAAAAAAQVSAAAAAAAGPAARPAAAAAAPRAVRRLADHLLQRVAPARRIVDRVAPGRSSRICK